MVLSLCKRSGAEAHVYEVSVTSPNWRAGIVKLGVVMAPGLSLEDLRLLHHLQTGGDLGNVVVG